jgi:hypothetical protein
MGTSQSSAGSPSGVPMVPPWTPDPLAPDAPVDGDDDQADDDSADEDAAGEDGKQAPPATLQPVAPPARFRGARLNLGKFGGGGERQGLQRGVGQYFRGGMGGSGTASRRFGGTAQTAGALYDALSGAAGSRATEVARRIDSLLAEDADAYRLIDAIVEVVRPVDGTQDGEASRESIHDALSDVLNRFPDADLRRLSSDQRDLVIELFVAGDVFRRFMLDVGGAIRDAAPSAVTALSRLKEARDYIRETIVAAFRNLREAGQRMTAGGVSKLVNSALREAIVVFEGYAE